MVQATVLLADHAATHHRRGAYRETTIAGLDHETVAGLAIAKTETATEVAA